MRNKYLLKELLTDHLLKFIESEKNNSTEVQTLIFSKDVFKSADEAKSWAEKNGFKNSKVDETEESYRLRQVDPSLFEKSSFRTISFKGAKGIKAVVGKRSK